MLYLCFSVSRESCPIFQLGVSPGSRGPGRYPGSAPSFDTDSTGVSFPHRRNEVRAEFLLFWWAIRQFIVYGTARQTQFNSRHDVLTRHISCISKERNRLQNEGAVRESCDNEYVSAEHGFRNPALCCDLLMHAKEHLRRLNSYKETHDD
jgi:hypothetical protein